MPLIDAHAADRMSPAPFLPLNLADNVVQQARARTVPNEDSRIADYPASRTLPCGALL